MPYKELGYVPWLRSWQVLLYKELLLEWRGLHRTSMSLLFTVLVLLLFSFADGASQTRVVYMAPGFYWLAIILSSLLSVQEAMRLEQEGDALEGLQLLGVHPVSVFLAKSMSNCVHLFFLAIVAWPLVVGLYDVRMVLGLPALALVALLGCAGLSAPATLYAAIAARVRGGAALLPLLVLPVVLPLLIAAVKATQLVCAGDPMQQWDGWISLMGMFAVLYWVLCGLLAVFVLEDR